MKKQLIEKTVLKEANVYEVIKESVEKKNAWVFISENLFEKLSAQYTKKDVVFSNAVTFVIPEDDGHIASLMVEPIVPNDSSWSKIHLLRSMGTSIYIPENPDYIVFLS